MQFRCEACGQLKPYEEIEVMKFGISEFLGGSSVVGEGSTRNVNYCHNNPECVTKAKEIVKTEKIKFQNLLKCDRDPVCLCQKDK